MLGSCLANTWPQFIPVSLTTSGANNRKAPLVTPSSLIPPMATATSSLYSPPSAATATSPQPPVAATWLTNTDGSVKLAATATRGSITF